MNKSERCEGNSKSLAHIAAEFGRTWTCGKCGTKNGPDDLVCRACKS